jgi:hypothetical protein
MTTVTRNGSQLLTAVLGAVLLGGCVHIERYPRSWEPVRAGTNIDCTAVAATYTNEGESSSGSRALLATWIEPRQYKTPADQAAYETDLIKAQTVQLRLTANVLTIVANGENIHREWSFDSTRHEFECNRGVICFPRFEVANDIVFGVSKGSDDLFRVADHLVVRSRGGAVGFAFIVPVAGFGTSWGRFAVTRSPGGSEVPQGVGKSATHSNGPD